MKAVLRLLPLDDLADIGLCTVRSLDRGLSALPRLETALLIGLFLFLLH